MSFELAVLYEVRQFLMTRMIGNKIGRYNSVAVRRRERFFTATFGLGEAFYPSTASGLEAFGHMEWLVRSV
jgi:hypothetical protein